MAGSIAFIAFIAVWISLACPASGVQRRVHSEPLRRTASGHHYQQQQSDDRPQQPSDDFPFPYFPLNPNIPNLQYYSYFPYLHGFPFAPHVHETLPDEPEIVPPFIHQPFPSSVGFQTAQTLDPGCQWKMVFKAVAGNGRDVFTDLVTPGNINTHTSSAQELVTPLIFRDGDVLDSWDHLIVSKVKLEMYVGLVRGVWFIFDGIGTQLNSWFRQEKLIASPYHDVKGGSFDIFSLDGDSSKERRLLIAREQDICSADCMYLAVVDPQSSPACGWESVTGLPAFAYGVLTDECSHFNTAGQIQYADRLVISVKVCEARVFTD